MYHAVCTVRAAVFVSGDDFGVCRCKISPQSYPELTMLVNPLPAWQVRAATVVGSTEKEHTDFIAALVSGSQC